MRCCLTVPKKSSTASGPNNNIINIQLLRRRSNRLHVGQGIASTEINTQKTITDATIKKITTTGPERTDRTYPQSLANYVINQQCRSAQTRQYEADAQGLKRPVEDQPPTRRDQYRR